mmetsp:Transcript_22429/g.64100  ORF Transcript_22429/g.64100 Transcript_22429/m.64100 type:complete len:85 (-) Transcript_22429:119-373(-)
MYHGKLSQDRTIQQTGWHGKAWQESGPRPYVPSLVSLVGCSEACSAMHRPAAPSLKNGHSDNTARREKETQQKAIDRQTDGMDG